MTDKDNTKIVPHVNKVYFGQDAIFRCQSRGNISWFRGKSIDKVERINYMGQLLNVKSVRGHHGGFYFCHGRKSTHKNSTFLAMSFMIIYCEFNL